MKKRLVFIFVSVIALHGAMTAHSVVAGDYPGLKGGSFIDEFDDGVLGSEWNTPLALDGSSVSEVDGALTFNIAAGPVVIEGEPNTSQFADIGTKEEILIGNFDVQVEFRVDPEYHNKGQTNAVFVLSVIREPKVIDHIQIGIYAWGYVTDEVREDPSGNVVSFHYWTPSDDTDGKLRIQRQGNLITTYYWDGAWVQHAQWRATSIGQSDNLGIGFAAWNWEPEYSPFWVKWDNLTAYWQKK